MKQQVFFISGGTAYTNYEDYLYDLEHGPMYDLADENSKPRWDKSLRDTLGDDYQVFTPKMPNSSNAQYAEWALWFERFHEYLHESAILIGWSLGASFLARYVSENSLSFQIKALY